MEAVIAAAMQLGIGGLFGALWWIERSDRLKVQSSKDDTKQILLQANANNSALFDLVKGFVKAAERSSATQEILIAEIRELMTAYRAAS